LTRDVIYGDLWDLYIAGVWMGGNLWTWRMVKGLDIQ
jgi:hypothetical protein